MLNVYPEAISYKVGGLRSDLNFATVLSFSKIVLSLMVMKWSNEHVMYTQQVRSQLFFFHMCLPTGVVESEETIFKKYDKTPGEAHPR